MSGSPDAPPFGYSSEKIGFLISLNDDGSPAAHADRPARGRRQEEDAAADAGAAADQAHIGRRANFLWDKTSYALGVTAGEGKPHYRRACRISSSGTEELSQRRTILGLKALARFSEIWTTGPILPRSAGRRR